MKRRLLILAGLLFIFLFMQQNQAYSNELIPDAESALYYKSGGGEDVPLPAFYETSYLPLNVEANVGLGFNCGAFNPAASLTNSLNQIKSSFLAVKEQVLSNATGAVTEFPLYELSRVDPNLYNFITDAMGGAREDMAISTKSCEVIQSEIASGEDPYAHWGEVSLGNQWKAEMSDSSLSGNGDINEAQDKISKDAGKSGVPWVNPNQSMQSTVGTYYAGGINQTPIHVIHDTAMAGYQVLINKDSPSLEHRFHDFDESSELQKIWSTPELAATWMTNSVGDQIFTTYNGGPKSSQPGTGLYTDIQTETTRLIPLLQALVKGETEITVENLQAVSVEGMALSPDMIHSLQHQSPVTQTIMINKLAQNLGAMNVMNEVRLGIEILQAGSKIPAIYGNQAAQAIIENAIQSLKQEVQDILMFVQARQTLVSNMLSTILQANASQTQQNTAIAMPTSNGAAMEQGAVRD
jgi:integrating conjugative element protein (TIGR03755 family)